MPAVIASDAQWSDMNERTAAQLLECAKERDKLRAALIRLRDCDWTIGRGDRMDPVREIAREALEETT